MEEHNKNIDYKYIAKLINYDINHRKYYILSSIDDEILPDNIVRISFDGDPIFYLEVLFKYKGDFEMLEGSETGKINCHDNDVFVEIFI